MANSSGYSYVLPAVAADLEARLAEARESGASCLRECPVESMELLLHPSRSGDVAAGVREHMDASLLKCVNPRPWRAPPPAPLCRQAHARRSFQEQGRAKLRISSQGLVEAVSPVPG